MFMRKKQIDKNYFYIKESPRTCIHAGMTGNNYGADTKIFVLRVSLLIQETDGTI